MEDASETHNMSRMIRAFVLAGVFVCWIPQVSSFSFSIHCVAPSAISASSLGTSQSQSLLTFTRSCLNAAPDGALSDIVIPSVFTGGLLSASTLKEDDEEDHRVWVPQTDCLSFRPLCFCVSQGYYVNLLKFKGGGVLGCHRHPSPVHALTLKGGWGYEEHDWHAEQGTYVFEPPGETHTLIVDEDCDE